MRMLAWDAEDGRLLLASAAVLLVLYLLFAFGDPVDDVVVFYGYSERFAAGELPYRDFNDFYPPFAWFFILFPGIFADDIRIYCAIYAAIITMVMFLTLCVVLNICRGHGVSTRAATAVYMTMTVIYYSQAIRKFDIAAALFMAVSVGLFLNGRHAWAYPAALVGGLIKVFPLFAGLAFLALSVRDRGAVRGTAVGLGICAAVAAAVFVPLLVLFDPAQVMNFIVGNSDRGFQQESMMATVSVILCRVAGMETGVVWANSTWDVSNPICDALSGCWTAVTVATVLAVVAVVFVRASVRWMNGGDADRIRVATASLTAVLIAFMLSNRVFSTQYIQWLFPLIPLLLAGRTREDAVFVSVLAAVIVLLSWSAPAIYLCQVVLLIRDLLMVYLGFLCLRYAAGGGWSFVPRCLEDLMSGRSSGHSGVR